MKRHQWHLVVELLERLWPKSTQLELLADEAASAEWSAQFEAYELKHVLEGARRWAAVSSFPPRIAELKSSTERVRDDEKKPGVAAKRVQMERLPFGRTQRCAAAADVVMASIRLGTCEDTTEASNRLFHSLIDDEGLFEFRDQIMRELRAKKPPSIFEKSER